ncbi:MAG TPA: type IV pilus modification protein PilV [Steroidobacter sp.]|jgi:type IV pilus assembly protein PilV|nr:type IV pilus modification protein PilV [Steroidobacter sp.]
MRRTSQHQAGVTLIEVLVAVIVTVIGLLGMVALQMRSYASEAESYQRAQAAILLEDMVNRIRANPKNVANYVAEDIGVAAMVCTPAPAALAARDLCEWANLLKGAAETYEAKTVGAMTAARGCIRAIDVATNTYAITVVWQGSVSTAEPGSTCGQAAFADQTIRRALSTVVRIPKLAV